MQLLLILYSGLSAYRTWIEQMMVNIIKYLAGNWNLIQEIKYPLKNKSKLYFFARCNYEN